MAITQEQAQEGAGPEVIEATAHRAMGIVSPALLAGAITTLLVMFACPALIAYTPVIVSASVVGAYVAMRFAARTRQ